MSFGQGHYITPPPIAQFKLIFNEYEIQHFGQESKNSKITGYIQNIKYKLPKTGSKMPFIAHFYSLLINTCIQVQISQFDAI